MICLYILATYTVHYRKLPKNMILGVLWFANKKPTMQVFLKPVITELKKLEEEGVCYSFSMENLIGLGMRLP